MIKNHYGITIDSNVAITGVININSVSSESLHNDIYYGSGINLSFENYKREHEKFCNNNECIQQDHEMEYDQYYVDSDTYIVGYVKDDKGLYMPDTTKNYSFIVGESTLQITYSKTFKLCLLCSPCYPGQGDLNSEGGYLTYCLPVDYFDDYSNFDTSKILTFKNI